MDLERKLNNAWQDEVRYAPCLVIITLTLKCYITQLDANDDGAEYDDNLADDDEALVAYVSITVSQLIPSTHVFACRGDFSSALGDDFFGLRALGLEKELGLTSLSVPSRLFHGRARKDAGRLGDG